LVVGFLYNGLIRMFHTLAWQQVSVWQRRDAPFIMLESALLWFASFLTQVLI
jgi:hypothetical protein